MSGRWVTVSTADGTPRQDWVPAEQPKSPDGAPGQWHIVTPTAGGDPVWEWHEARTPIPPRNATPEPRPPADRYSTTPTTRPPTYFTGPTATAPHPTAPIWTGLAITSLVIGAITLLLCWVPVLNNGVIIAAVIGIVIGIVGWQGTNEHQYAGGIAIAGMCLAILAAVGVFATQAYYGHVMNGISDDFKKSFHVDQ